MYNSQTSASQYQQAAIQTMPPDKLLLYVYDGAIKSLNLAKEALITNDIEGVNNHLQKAQAIITELMVTLDMEYEISHRLYSLYEYFNFRLIQANIRKDVSPVNEVLNHMIELRSTWAKASELTKKQSSDQSMGGVNFAR